MEYRKQGGGGALLLWDEDDNTVVCDCIAHAQVLLTPSTVVFGDGTEKHFPKARMCDGYPKYVKKSQLLETIDLSHLKEGLKDEVRITFEGVVFKITGEDVRMRIRAYAHFDGKLFGYPDGIMHLRCEDANMSHLVYNELLKTTKELQAKAKAQ